MFAMSRTASRLVRLLPAIVVAVLCAACSDFWVSDSAVASVSVSPTTLILKAASSAGTPGDSANVTASTTTVGGTTSDATTTAAWTSNATSVATVDAAGKVTAVSTSANQTATITAKAGGESATCAVLTYTGTAPTTITITPVNVSPNLISPGQKFKVNATANISGNSNQDISSFVSWTSNAPSVATVDSSGNVTVLSTATTGNNFTITATANFAGTTVTGTSTTFSIPIV